MNKNKLLAVTNFSPPILKALESGEVDMDSLPDNVKVRLREILVENLIKKAAEDFETYVEVMASEVLPEEFVTGRHITIICRDLQKIEKSIHEVKAIHRNKQSTRDEKKVRAKRSQYFLPPRSMKSKLISNLFVAWFLGRNPNMDVLHIGHSTKFCIDNFGRANLELLNSDKHKAIFPDPRCRVKRTARSAQSFQLVGGGKYYTTGAGSKIAGRGGALLISDDVVSEQDAYSDNVRNKINEWYFVGARTRMQPHGAEIVVNTRWHLEDLSGYLQEKDKGSSNPWNIIKFPAILDLPSAKMLGLKEGDSYWPELWPVDKFHEDRRVMAPSKFNAMYQQNPIPDEGTIISEKYWQEWDEDKEGDDVPWCEAVIASLDTAYSEKQRADYSAYTVWGIFFKRERGRNGFEYTAANIFLLGAEKGRWPFNILCEKVEYIKDTWNPDYYIIENKASGQSLIQELRLKQYPVAEFNPGRDDKVTRAHASVPTFISKRVWYPKGKAWAKEVIGETCSFPFAPHDDMADTVWQAIIWFRKGLIVPSEGELGYEDQLDDGNASYQKKQGTYWSTLSNNR